MGTTVVALNVKNGRTLRDVQEHLGMKEGFDVGLETMRQPLKEGRVTISRAAGTMTFPSQFMLVAAMNPTGFVAFL